MFFNFFRRNQSGVTSIEYALMAGVIGTGIAVSATYVLDEFEALVASQGCTWVTAEVDENGDHGPQRCVFGTSGQDARKLRP